MGLRRVTMPKTSGSQETRDRLQELQKVGAGREWVGLAERGKGKEGNSSRRARPRQLPVLLVMVMMMEDEGRASMQRGTTASLHAVTQWRSWRRRRRRWVYC